MAPQHRISGDLVLVCSRSGSRDALCSLCSTVITVLLKKQVALSYLFMGILLFTAAVWPPLVYIMTTAQQVVEAFILPVQETRQRTEFLNPLQGQS